MTVFTACQRLVLFDLLSESNIIALLKFQTTQTHRRLLRSLLSMDTIQRDSEEPEDSGISVTKDHKTSEFLLQFYAHQEIRSSYRNIRRL
jgi:hypothetical protein